METHTLTITESQLRLSLDIVLREFAQAILSALPQHPLDDPLNSPGGAESGSVLPKGKLLVTMSEAANMLSVSRSMLHKMVYEGQLRTIQIGRSRRVPMSSLQEFIAMKLQGPD